MPPRNRPQQERRPQGPGLPIGRFFGVPVFLAPSWLLAAALITVSYSGLVEDYVDDITSGQAYLVAFGFSVLLLLSVLAHELGHTLVGLALGMPVRRIVLFLLGGVSEVVGQSRRPADEYLVAVAGPMVSLMLAGLGAALMPLTEPETVADVLLGLFVGSNLAVMVFNILPGLPLDGGRLLSAAVWRLSGDRHTGVRAAAWAGRGVAVAVLALAVPLAGGGGYWFATIVIASFLAAFIWVGASQSLTAATIESRVPALKVADLARPTLDVPATMPVSEALRQAWSSGRRALVVVDTGGEPMALVSEQHVRALPEQRRPWTTVSEVSRPLEPGLRLPDTLRGRRALEALRRTPATEYLVIRPDGQTVGVLAATDVAHILQRGHLPNQTPNGAGKLAG